MSLKAILTIAALSVSLSAVHAYADGGGAEGNGDPFPFRAMVEATRLEPVRSATRADTAPPPAIAVLEPSRLVVARPTSVVAHRMHAGVSGATMRGYEETDISTADIQRLRR